MFASLKSKIKEETGSDISKLTSSWRNGSFLGRISLKDDSTVSPSSSGGHGDSTSDSLSPQLESYLVERTGGQIDNVVLQSQYTLQLEEKLRERDAIWEKKIEELKISLSTVQGEEAAAAQSIARAAQAEAAEATAARELAERQLTELKARLSAATRAEERLDALTEELEASRREWARDRAELTASLSLAEARAQDLADELAVVRAALPPDNPHHHINDEDKKHLLASGCEQFDRVVRERGVLSRQLQEAKMALADVKTSWSGQIASLETQVARLSRQAGEEGAERRRIENELRELNERLQTVILERDKAKTALVNSEAKVTRLNSEVHSLAMELKSLRNASQHAAILTFLDREMELENALEDLLEQNKELNEALERERERVRTLEESVSNAAQERDDMQAELANVSSSMTELQHDYLVIQRKYDKERREKDEALLRNAHMSQTIELSQCDVRYQRGEIADLKAKLEDLDAAVAQHKENQANCMLIKENEVSRLEEIEQLKNKVTELADIQSRLETTIQELETQLADKNKKIKTLENRISDMKKTLQRELQNSKSDLSSAEEADISRRYLKHVLLRFLTARELEARQLTRALAALLRLSAHEEALLREALPPRTGLAAWLPSLGNT
ncbi:Golgin subfamily A member 1 [Eumeta japonica]|uniref:Golgin subfamily A member 1 n=1 Tax=Eumeta variegata TaxID=151549 RepID=A0A4C1U9L6_EUMVA|nr:Golgin subfamily A member 1 [Eumeta japonica]